MLIEMASQNLMVGMLSQMNLFRDNLVTVLRQRVRDLEIENGDLKQRITTFRQIVCQWQRPLRIWLNYSRKRY